MKSVVILVAMLGFGLPGDAHAQDADIAAGKAYAEEVCARCHAVLAGEDMSPDFSATPFEQVAKTPGMTEMALSVFLQTPHIDMPNLILEQDDARNVIAYIRSLDGRE
ncbi:MAG: cytochrome C [Methyloceanibacter sp.]|nr:cytochrome C [Methyloceanibacter sp.]